MYTAKLNLSPENVDDVLAVASFLQMQDIITACHTLRSLAEPTSTTGENTEASAVEGKVIGRLLLKSGFLQSPCPAPHSGSPHWVSDSSLHSLWGAGKGWLALLKGSPCLPLLALGQGNTWATRCPGAELLPEARRCPPGSSRALRVSSEAADSYHGPWPWLSTGTLSVHCPCELTSLVQSQPQWLQNQCPGVRCSLSKLVKYLGGPRGTQRSHLIPLGG